MADQPARALRDISPQTPDWLVASMEKLMAKSPNDRFQSAGELARLLDQHLHEGKSEKSSVALKEEATDSATQKQVLVSAAASSALRVITNSGSAITPIEVPRTIRQRQFTVALFGMAMIAVIGVWVRQSVFRGEPAYGTPSEIQNGKDQKTVMVKVSPALVAGKDLSEADEKARGAESAKADDIKEAFAWPVEDLWHGHIAAPDFSHSKELFRDDFESLETAWQIGKSAGYEYRLEQGSYFIYADPGLVGGAWLAEKTYANFACEVVGRVQVVNTQWFLNYTSEANDVTVRFHLNGLQGLEVSILNDGPPRVAQTIRHTAIHTGEEFNKLLVVAVNHRFEIYANDVAICNPIVLDEMTPPGRFALGAVANENPVRAEFKSFTVWSAEGLPTLEERLIKGDLHKSTPAVAKPKHAKTPLAADPAPVAQ